jgi:hypothetical protein
MRITTAWIPDPDTGDGPPFLVAAHSWLDEPPSTYIDEVARWNQVRELVIEIDNDAVRALFDPPTVKGEVR